jgi:hypothetical protein
MCLVTPLKVGAKYTMLPFYDSERGVDVNNPVQVNV